MRREQDPNVCRVIKCGKPVASPDTRYCAEHVNIKRNQQAKKPCQKPGCPVLVAGDERFCADHQHLDTRAKPWGTTKLTRQQRGYGANYQKQRLMKLRENPICQIAKVCVERLGHPAFATCVDHIVALSNGGSEDYSNLQSACDACNQWKAAAIDSKQGKAA